MTEAADNPAAAVEASRPANASPAVSATITPPVVPPPHVQVRTEPRRPGKFRRFVRSVFSHLIFAALVTAGVFGYVYQDMILGRVATTVCGNDALGPYAPGGSKSAAAAPAATKPVSTTASPPAPSSTPAPAVAAAPPPAKSPDVKPVASSETAGKVADASPSVVAAPPAKAETSRPLPAKTEAAKPAPAKADAAKAEPAQSAPAKAAPVVSAPAAPSSAVAAAPSPPVAPTPAKPAVEKTAPAAQEALASAWRAAREAFNDGKPDAIDAYRSLLRAHPDVPDLAGELGNIYYAAGKWREASEQYYEAAQRYLKSPQPGYAACLLDVLRNLRAPEAERLAPQITRPCPATRAGQPGQNTGQAASNPPRG